MVKYLLLVLMVTGSTFSLYSQRLSGKWEGKLIQEDGGLTHEYGFRMVLSLTGSVVGGYTEVWLPDSPENFSRMNIRGSLRGAMLTFEETEISESEIVPMWEWCLKQGELMMDTSGTEWVLSGSWRGTAITPDCSPGMADLRRPGPARVAEKPDTVPVVETPVEPVKPVLELNEQNLPESIEGRRVTKQRTASVNTRELQIYVWDSDEIDGDIISLNFNGDWIVEDLKLKRNRTMFTLQLSPDNHNYLILYARNEGRIPPNTAAISWIQNGKYVTTAMMSDMENCGAIQFNLK